MKEIISVFAFAAILIQIFFYQGIFSEDNFIKITFILIFIYLLFIKLYSKYGK